MRNKRILLLILLAIFICNISFSQELQQYEGAFNIYGTSGYAKYSYYDNDDGRLFNGPYYFISNDKTIVINGFYKNNLKHGNWKIELNNSMLNTIECPINAACSVEFSEGKLDGKASFYRNPISCGLNKRLLFDESTVEFKNNHFTGKFIYEKKIVNSSKGIISKVKITGFFDDFGMCDSIWEIQYLKDNIEYVEKIDFVYGIAISDKTKNMSNGNVTKDLTLQLNENFIKNFDKIKNEYIALDTNKFVDYLKITPKVYSLLRWEGNCVNVNGYPSDNDCRIQTKNLFLEYPFCIWANLSCNFSTTTGIVNFLDFFNRDSFEVQSPFNKVTLHSKRTSELEKYYKEQSDSIIENRKY